MDLKVVIERDEDGGFVATCPSLPGCISQGETEKETLNNIKEAIVLHIKCLAEDGIPIKADPKKKEFMVSVNL
jgi:predicted RNase H-like HicB family nuclease